MDAAALKPTAEPHSLQWLNLKALASAPVRREPYPYLIAGDVLSPGAMPELTRTFPAISRTGFLPLSLLARDGAFDALLKELEGPELAALLTDKFGIELRDKPRMITIRRWSALKDGRIHNDSESKIFTALLYLNAGWKEGETGGRLRVLHDDKDFENYAAEVPPLFGTFFCFQRTGNSWHGHKPFAGERRVIQITWLQSWEDYHRKEKRGRFSHFLKKLKPGY
jgi:hypothetical protein